MPHLSCSTCLRQGRVLRKKKNQKRNEKSVLRDHTGKMLDGIPCYGEYGRAYQRAQSSADSELAMKGLSICLMAWSPQRILQRNVVSYIYHWWVNRKDTYHASATSPSNSLTISSRREAETSPLLSCACRSRIYFFLPPAPSKTSLPRQSLWKACWQGKTKNWRLRTGSEQIQHLSPGSTIA